MPKLEIPKQQIRYVVGRLHVWRTDDEVRDEILTRVAAARARNPKPWTAEMVQRCVKFAVKTHRDNQILYMQVTRGGMTTGEARRIIEARMAE